MGVAILIIVQKCIPWHTAASGECAVKNTVKNIAIGDTLTCLWYRFLLA
jgi:hypothetical protein